MKKIIFSMACLAVSAFSLAQQKAEAVIHLNQGQYQINRNIYGQFSEHLGRCIYDGLWVGENSSIPNINGVRKDIIDALKEIKISNLRWPGGCFADEYHWMDGIGPREKRPKMVNTNWGGVVEDNSFGTHEFLNLCEALGTEPYICGNVGSGAVEEMSKWVEYITSDAESPMVNLRKKNGREKPWKVHFWGVGNENWGCGGNMTPEYYADQYRRYATFCRDYGDNKLYKIAGGPNSNDSKWMEVMMRDIPNNLVKGVSVHNYTFTNSWTDKGDAIDFNETDYFKLLKNGYGMDKLISDHATIMDKYDPKKEIGMIVDEWGTWYDQKSGTKEGVLYQQNSLRDALLAGIILNIFQQHCDRVKMANIAQMVNVLQSLFLTKDEKMILTPTYHVFDMYKVHQDATMIPVDLESPSYTLSGEQIKAVSVSASRDKEGKTHVSFVNILPREEVEISCKLDGNGISRVLNGNYISAPQINSYNSFESPNVVNLKDFKNASLKNGILKVKLPAKSLVTIELN